MLAGESVKDLVGESRSTVRPVQVAPPGLIDAGRSVGLKSYEADRLARPPPDQRTEDELKLVKAAAALYDEIEAISQKEVPGCPRAEQPGLFGKTRLPRGGHVRSTFYDIKFHQPGFREIRHLLLADLITDIHTRSRGTYGMLRIRAALEIEQGIIVNKKLVWKIMRQRGLKGLPGPKKRSWNPANEATEEDLVERRFTAGGPNELWLTDITEHRPAKARSIAVWSWTCSHARQWAGPSTGAVRPPWSTTPCRWRPGRGSPPRPQ